MIRKRCHPFIISLTLCWITILLTWQHFNAQCTANPACSGEFGVFFVLLGNPWSIPLTKLNLLPPILSIGLAIFINTVIISTIIQLLFHLISTKVKIKEK